MKKLGTFLALVIVLGVLGTRGRVTPSRVAPTETASTVAEIPAAPEINLEKMRADFDAVEKSIARSEARLAEARAQLDREERLYKTIEEVEDRFDRGELSSEDYLERKKEIALRLGL